MPPWTRKVIASHLDKVTVKNYEDVAQKIVKELDTRSLVQHLAAMLVRQANKWYAPSFHEKHDVQKRNLCDNMVGSLLHALALRIKPIKGVPTAEGLSGIPLFKADLLSVWIYRRMSIGPVAAALFNSRNLSIDDLRVVVRACLESAYTANVRNIGDALLLLEVGGRQLDAEDPESFANFLEEVKAMLLVKRAKSSQRLKIGDRLVPSLLDRYETLLARYRQGWQVSPYGPATSSNSTQVLESSAPHGEEPAKDVHLTDNHSASTNHTPSPESPTSIDEEHESSEVHTDTAQNDIRRSSPDTALKGDTIWTDGKTHHGFVPVSPWNEYFAQVMAGSEKRRPRPSSLIFPEAAEQRQEDMEMVDDERGQPVPLSRHHSMCSTASSIGRNSLYAARAQMEIMSRDFPAELMRTPTDHVGREQVKGRGAVPSSSEALGLHKHLRGDKEKGVRRRVNSEVQMQTALVQAAQSGPRRASEALAPLPISRPKAREAYDDDAKAFPATFHGDAIWIQLDRPEPFGIHVRFPSDFRIGDAQRIARHLSEALRHHGNPEPFDQHPHDSILHFTPSGSVVQDLSFGDKSVFVEYSPDMTLAQARSVGVTLSEAASQLAV
jgi:hypothetical protein